MKYALTIPLLLALCAVQSHAQSTRTWRCGNTYTNIEADAKAHDCKLVEGGNLTVVEGTRVHNPTPVRLNTAVSGASRADGPARESQRIEAAEQKVRDAEARSILEGELRKAQMRQAELLKEWNNGEPEKLGPETRNHQKYLDRVADLKASLARTENDISGIQRELGRLPAAR